MEIELVNVGKRFSLDWIFRKVNFKFQSGLSYALTGHNGSGKSTMLKILSGGSTPSEGKVIYRWEGKELTQLQVAEKVSYAAPYIHLIDDFTLEEMLEFHFRFKRMKVNSVEEMLDIIELKVHRDKIISKFSSGMMQRLKLALAILTESEVLLLDEPTSYLDEKAIQWYKNLLETYLDNRILIIGSNQKHEYAFVQGGILNVPDFQYIKKSKNGVEL